MPPTSSLPRRTLLSGLVGGAAAVGLAACGAAAGDTRGAGGSAPTSASSATDTAAPSQGGHLTAAFVGGSIESPSVLQTLMTGVTDARGRAIWDGLGDIVDGRPHWRLAESVEPNATATTWTIRVRRGVVFSDGSPVTAADVAASLRAFIVNRSVQAGLLIDVDPKRMRVRDAHTLELTLTRPNGLLDQGLAQGMFIFPASTTDPNRALGSGPFISQSFRSGQGSVLRRNPNYWGDKGPYLDTLELVSVADAGARYNGVKAGQYDYAGSVSLSAARAERDNPDLRIAIPEQRLWSGVLLMGNTAVAPFNDVNVRRAVHHAFDRDAMARTIGLGFGEPGNDLFAKGDPWYATDVPQFGYDPDRTRSALAKAGHAGLRLSVTTSDFQYGMLEADTAWIDQAAAAGIAVTLDKINANDYYSDIPKLMRKPMTTQPATPFPLGQSYFSYYGSQASYPFSGLTRAADGVVNALRRAVSESAQRTAAHALQEWTLENAAQYIPVRLPSVALASSKVHGVDPAGFAEYPLFRDAFLS